MFTERRAIIYFWLAIFGFEISSMPIALLPWTKFGPGGSAVLTVFVAAAFLVGLVLGYGSFLALDRFVRGKPDPLRRARESEELGKGRFVFTCTAGIGADLVFCFTLLPLLLHALGLVPVPLVLRCLDAALALMCFHLRNILNSRAYRLCCLRFGLRAEEQ